MLITKKMLLALTLVGALVGAGIGALVTRSASNTGAAKTNYDSTQTANSSAKTPDQLAAENSSQFKTSQEQTAYRQGFDDGYTTCGTAENNTSTGGVNYPVTYREPARHYSGRRYYSSRYYNGSRRVSYDYGSAPGGLSFLQERRD